MPTIHPVSDHHNHFAEITKEIQASNEPIFLTKNGVGSVVVVSMESHEQNLYDSMIYNKRREAEMQASTTTERFTHEDVMAVERKQLEKRHA